MVWPRRTGSGDSQPLIGCPDNLYDLRDTGAVTHPARHVLADTSMNQCFLRLPLPWLPWAALYRTVGPMLTDKEIEARPDALGSKLNWLRAGVLGANDGIVSVAGLVMGVAGATTDNMTILIAGLAGLVAGALSMAGGEYVSVSTQRDTEIAALERQTRALAENPDHELKALAYAYSQKGISRELALQVARELSEKDALAAHAEAELGIDSDEQVSPWLASVASAIAFILGALIPLLTMVLAPAGARIWSTVAAVLIALVLTGFVSARLGGARTLRAVLRNVIIGSLAMGLTHFAGTLVGTGVA